MSWFKQNIFILLLLFVITLIAYGQTLFMYFLIDDNALIYKLQHLDQTLGLWGKGLLGEGPYRFRVVQFVPFYPIFGINPMPYFAVGLFLYYLSSITLYFFVSAITKSKFIAFASAVIFASGFIGSETMFGITNSWETNRGIIMMLAAFLCYFKFLNTKRLFFYILSILLFFFSLETVYIRAHGLIFALIAFDLLFLGQFLRFKTIINSGIRLLPFILIYYKIYLVDTGGELKRFGIWNILESAFSEGRLAPLTIPLQDVGNLFIPDILTSRIDRVIVNFIALPVEFSVGSLLSGIFIFTFLLVLILKFKKEYLVRVLAFSFLFAIANFILFYVREAEHTLWSIHRYFSYSFVGSAIFWATSFYLLSLWNRRLFGLLTVLLVILYLSFNINLQYDFNQRRSLPAKNFFSDFDQMIPTIPKGAITYFDLQNDNYVRGQFGSFFGGMFSEASNLAIYTGPEIDYMNDFLFTYKFNDILKGIVGKSTTLDKVFTFYYGEDGLVNTTADVRQLLENKKTVNISPLNISSTTSFRADRNNFFTATDISSAQGGWIGKNPTITIVPPDNAQSFVPSKITFLMSAKLVIPPLPYKSEGSIIDISAAEKDRIFNYISSQNNFRKRTEASSASFWKEQEPKFAIDGRLETSWRGHRGFWDEIDRGRSREIEFFSIDLKKPKLVSQVIWISAQRPLVPTRYKILTSTNGREWQLVKEIADGKPLAEGTIVVDSFVPTPARYVKMEILATFGNDGPEIKEFEVIESRFSDLDKRIVEKVKQSPFGKIETVNDFNNARNFVRQNANLRLYYQSSADSKQDPTRYVDIPLILDEKFHEYSIELPATGLSWTQFALNGFNFPAKLSVGDAKLIYNSVKD